MIYRYKTRNIVEFSNKTRASYSLKRYGPLLEKISILSEKEDVKIWNYYEEKESIIEIYYWNQKDNQIVKTIIDKDYKNLLYNYYWQLNCNGYFYTRTGTENNKRLYLHAVICENNKEIIDHIDKNPLNNCKDNLRATSFSGNGLNKESRNTYFDPRRNKWRARVIYKGNEYVEYFSLEEDAFKWAQNKKQEFILQESSTTIRKE